MRILITGIAGFIGSHLTQRLLHEKHTILGIDNFLTGSQRNLDWIGNHNIEFYEQDVCQPFPDKAVDAVIHLACPASPPQYQADPIRTFETIIVGTKNAIVHAKKYKAPLVIASTSEIYGDPNIHPQTEDYWGNVNPIGVRSCYDEGKRAAETLANDYRRLQGVDIRIARIFNTYGPRMAFDDGRVVSNFIIQALRHEPLTIYGQGQQTRSFCYVDDMVDGLIKLMQYPNPIPLPINLGMPDERTILEVANLLEHLLGRPVARLFKPLPSDDPGRRCPDITRAKMLLNWQPQIQLEEGLAKTLAAFTNRLQEEAMM